ncbi:hypothetical protein OEZ85_007379 [Tetradesmus obliquus]|uniref:AB hydrolase-1 domain-containing protein n=1 Tax=Tetradesmus obliquus TaxID=3088 RepID=A0ABY8TXZ1_TETOB|nr:hypothetical protein OEZ85_007379 [Tetradesmus obliquus]
MMERLYLDKACEATTFAVLVTNVAGWASALANAWGNGWHGNQFPTVWICLLGGMLAAQAYYVYKKPQVSAMALFRLWLWMVYAAFMASAAVILIVCYAIVPVPSSVSISPVGWWAVTWFPPVAFIAIYAHLHWQDALAAMRARKPEAAAGPLAEGAEATLNSWVTNPIANLSRSKPQRQRLASCLGWSSLFWGLLLTVVLVVQAAWQAADYCRFPAEAYGQLVDVTIDNTDQTASIFLRCRGPSNSSLATFLLEADAGAAAASLFGLQDELARAGRRSCAYDRLGLGWSDDIVMPGHLKRVPFTLKSLLEAADVPPPYILVGHGMGGQLALQYASMNRRDVAGLALLDSFSDTAHNLQAGVIVNTTGLWGRVTYTFLHSYPQRQLTRLSFLRAIAPLGFPRFNDALRRASGAPYAYQAEVAALTGSNKHYQGRWGEYAAGVAALPDSLDEQLLLAAPNNAASFWYGTGWLDLSPLPVVVMPAAASIADAGCQLTQAPCRESVLATPGLFLAKQVLAYRATLSSGASMAIMPGGHGFPWQDPATTASVLLQRFEGV